MKLVATFIFSLFNGLVWAETGKEGFQTNFDVTNWIFILIMLFVIYLTSGILRQVLQTLKQRLKGKSGQEEVLLLTEIEDIGEQRRVFIYLGLMFLALYGIYYFVEGTTWEAHVVEWLNLIVRWTHVVFGIAWIGASFYFNFLENALNRKEGLRDELAGNLWAIHGGGFYYLEKYKVAPKEIPKELHWFKYEAYFTWLSGFTLLVIVYYLDANVYLIDKSVLDISPQSAVGIGLVSLALGWLGYDMLCKSALAKRQTLFWFILFAFIAGFAWFFLQVFSPRAAYIHVGALIGTMMAGNVFRVIIPSQKAMVNAAKRGGSPNPLLGKRALQRSRHNNYLTLPVIFIMISNHFPTTYGNEWNWFILIGLSLTSVLVKHYLNVIEEGRKAVWIMPIAVVCMFGLTFISAPRPKEVCKDGEATKFEEVRLIVDQRCVQCHSENPTDDTQKVPPNGVVFDKDEDIVAYADRILNRAVVTKTMPQANKTEMTQEERDALQCWIDHGAKLK